MSTKNSFSTLTTARGVPLDRLRCRVLALDPGETTGWAVAELGHLEQAGQIEGKPHALTALFDLHWPEQVVCESYLIYPWKLREHAGSTVPTLRLIGAIELLCAQRSLPLAMQPAAIAKRFFDDQRLRELGLWRAGQPHARDAIRHALYWILFGT